ncbi:hypothetical protein A2U01_0097404, partial [Trifolium medium]|nr:hypothetical protein [Trifolium medium]
KVRPLYQPPTSDDTNLVETTQNQLKVRSKDGQSTEPSPTSTRIIKNTSDYCRQHGVPSPFEQIRPNWVLMSLARG